MTVARYWQRTRCPLILPVNVIDHPTRRDGAPQRTRRHLMLAAGAAALGGCASDSLSLIGSTLGVGAPRYPISDAQIEALPYASIGVRIGGGSGVVMILATVDDESLSWVSTDRVVLITRRGRLIKSIGLTRDLLHVRETGADPLALALRGDPAAAESRVARIIDIRPRDDFSVPVASRCERIGEDLLTVLGTPRRVIRLRERVVVRKWRWSADNLFWVDADSGRVWKSRQQFCPDVPAITIELLKPAAGML